MKQIKYILPISLLLILFCGCSSGPSTQKSSKAPYLIVVSLDGYRWDYQDRYETPFFDSIQQIGVKAESLQPSFPSKTFPNHYTIATGMYPNTHGLVSNAFYSSLHQDFYKIRDREKVGDGTYYGGEPIWVSAEKQGIKAASYFWVGSEADVKGIRPSIWKQYDGAVSYSARVDSVIGWLDKPYGERPKLCMLYFDEPDRVGHHYGPQSDSTQKMVEVLDQQLLELTTQINQLAIKDSVNIIVLSDHGMGAISSDRYHVINQSIDTSKIEYVLGSNPVYMVKAKASYHQKLKAEFNALEGITAWDKADVPEHLHYGTHENIAPIVVVADSAWSISVSEPGAYVGGTHGYDPTNKDMHGIFYAFGPSFKKGHTQATFENIHIYELMCSLIGIAPAENDGHVSNIKDMLK